MFARPAPPPQLLAGHVKSPQPEWLRAEESTGTSPRRPIEIRGESEYRKFTRSLHKGDVVEVPALDRYFDAQFIRLEVDPVWPDVADDTQQLHGTLYTYSDNVRGLELERPGEDIERQKKTENRRFLEKRRREVCELHFVVLDYVQMQKFEWRHVGDKMNVDNMESRVTFYASNIKRIVPLQRTNLDRVPAGRDLICRWRFRAIYQHREHVQYPQKAVACELVRFREDESGDHRASDRDIFKEFRSSGDRKQPEESWKNAEEGRYTFADAFCGGGGTSQGARRAGLSVVKAIDNWDDASFIYRRNFPEADVETTAVEDFLKTSGGRTPPVDVMHMSPPCQAFSPANTTGSARDRRDGGRQTTFCGPLLDAFRPRMFTLEQTTGMLHLEKDMGGGDTFTPWRDYFCPLVLQFTSRRYSVYWTVTSLTSLGLPARRRRLLMVGAAPGVSLPTPRLPAPTHRRAGDPNADPALPLEVTVDDVLRRLWARRLYVPRVALSVLGGAEPVPAAAAGWRALQLWRPDRRPSGGPGGGGALACAALPTLPLARCITTNANTNAVHPAGARELSLREMACFQGFPVDHDFGLGRRRASDGGGGGGGGVRNPRAVARKVLGNAFPGCVAAKIYRHLLRHLAATAGDGRAYVAPDDGDGDGGGDYCTVARRVVDLDADDEEGQFFARPKRRRRMSVVELRQGRRKQRVGSRQGWWVDDDDEDDDVRELERIEISDDDDDEPQDIIARFRGADGEPDAANNWNRVATSRFFLSPGVI